MTTENLFDNLYTGIINELATQHMYDETGHAFWKGQNAENNFARIARDNGYTWVEGSSTDDLIHHVDGTLITPTKKLKIEIKSSKSTRCPNDVLLEFRGGTGHKGWLYGQADFIAHEILVPYSFIMFSKPELLAYTEEKCDVWWKDDELVFDETLLTDYSCEAMAPALYNRKTDVSVITRINIIELRENVRNAIMYPVSDV